MRWQERIDRLLTERVILLAGWVWFLVYAFPGYMSYDSTWQLKQGRGLDPMSDWHPPLMAWVWGKLDAFIAGPFPMLVVQSVAFLLGTYALLARLMSKRAAAVAAVILLLLPQNIIVMAVIWKDSQMAGFLVASIALLLSEKRAARVFGYVLLFVATAYRYNAAAPTFPLILVLFDWHERLPWLRRYAMAVGLWLVVTLSAFGVNRLITQTKLHPWETGSATVDIYGTLRFADIDLQELVRTHPNVPWQHTEKMREHVNYWYRPSNSFIQAVEGESAILKYPANVAEREALGALWKECLRDHTGAFIEHRWKMFVVQLEAGVGVWEAFLPDEPTGVALHHQAMHSKVQRAWVQANMRLTRKRVFRPHMYFVLSLILICFTRRQRLAFAIFASGIAHEVGLFLVAPAVDYRYSHWMICATIVGAIVLFVGRRKRPA